MIPRLAIAELNLRQSKSTNSMKMNRIERYDLWIQILEESESGKYRITRYNENNFMITNLEYKQGADWVCIDFLEPWPFDLERRYSDEV